MEKDGKIIGQNVLVRARIQADDGRLISIMTMGPICIASELKRKGYGKILLDYSIQKAKEMGEGACALRVILIFMEKVDLHTHLNLGFVITDYRKVQMHCFLYKELIPGYLNGVTGEYTTPSGYFVDESEVDEYDKQFPYKEKLRLQGQLE